MKSVATPIDGGDALFENVAITVAGPTSKFTGSRIEDEPVEILRKNLLIQANWVRNSVNNFFIYPPDEVATHVSH